MAYTGHGHHIPGTLDDGTRPANVARCGGPGLCQKCRNDALQHPEYAARFKEPEQLLPLDPADGAVPKDAWWEMAAVMRKFGVSFQVAADTLSAVQMGLESGSSAEEQNKTSE